MSITVNYPFDTPGNYTYDNTKIEVTASTAQLKISDDPGQQVTEDFTNDTGFTYDNTKAEFVGGVVREKDQRPNNLSCAASYLSSIDLQSYSLGLSTGTAIGGASIINNQLDLTDGDKCVNYDANLNADNQQIGAFKFKFTPNYVTFPLAESPLITICKALGSSDNIVMLRIDTAGRIQVFIEDSSGVTITNALLGIWNSVQGQKYEFEFNYNITLGESRLFIDGTQFGSTQTDTGTRDTNISFLNVGGNFNNAQFMDGYFSDLQIFTTVQHTADYTSGYSVSETIYVESKVELPQFSYSGPGAIQQLTGFTTTEIGSPHYVLNNLYWCGSAWVSSDGSYIQSNGKATILANILTFPHNGVYTDIDIIFSDSSSVQSSVDELMLECTTQIYPTTNPTILTLTAITTQGIDSITITENSTITDYMRYTVEVGGNERYWNGSSWALSVGFVESNSITEIQENISTLDLSSGFEVKFICYLHSTSGLGTPSVSNISVVYDFYGGAAVTPNLCVVWGYIHDITNEPSENITIIIKSEQNSDYQEEILVTTTPKTILPDATGYWEISLFVSEELDPETKYIFDFKGTSFSLNSIKTVPNELSKNYLKLI